MFTLLLQLIIGTHFQGNVNVVLVCLLTIPVVSFALEVCISLVFAYFDNVRATRSFFTVPMIGRVFRFFSYLSEKKRAREPVVLFDEDDQSIQLVAAKRTGGLMGMFRVRNKSINFDERNYFLKVMAEALGFAVVHLRLDIIPGSFLEFALRLGLAFSKLEEDNQTNKASLQALAGGDMSKLMDWTQQQEAREEQRRQLVHVKSTILVRLNSYYAEWEKKLEHEEEREMAMMGSSEDEEQKERLRDMEGGESEVEDEKTGGEGEERGPDMGKKRSGLFGFDY